MRLEVLQPGYIEVVLSKRNVLALLHKVDQSCSKRAITRSEKPGVPDLMGRPGSDHTKLVVRVEPDEDHYGHEDRVVPGLAGRMHPHTEGFIDKHVTECNATDPLGHCVLPFGHQGDCFMDNEINA